MRLFTVLGLGVAFTLPAISQDNEIGLGVGFGFYRDVSITNAGGTAQAGFGPRFALSAAAGHNWGQHFAAEARYTYQDGDLELSPRDAKPISMATLTRFWANCCCMVRAGRAASALLQAAVSV
jgi:hypothetical protein